MGFLACLCIRISQKWNICTASEQWGQRLVQLKCSKVGIHFGPTPLSFSWYFGDGVVKYFTLWLVIRAVFIHQIIKANFDSMVGGRGGVLVLSKLKLTA